ncbi:Major Facilitator Superfamily protein [Anatilimnocola aggregata]|uniref:Major Facilitator Superfamily protein n=1 Tax=Anatilimnocola aggregata TaxID=2528021 RepID=A0A517YCN7_9BACT|nr:MFS transporter [Anatilimnocola aggregata]QDU28006.1 Major Facilitator Superfamily protein [Anatilimnocola aggregata]
MKTETSEHPQRWTQLAWLSVCNLLAMTLWFSVSAVAPALKTAWELSPLDQAWLTISVQIGFATGALASAVWNLADRWPAPRLLAASALIGALLSATIPLLFTNEMARTHGGFLLVLLLRGATGAMLAGIYPVGMKLMASWFRQGRGLAIGIMVGALTVGSALPHLIRILPLDQMAAQFLPSIGGSLPETWRLVLLTASGCSLLAAMLGFIFLRSGPWLPNAATFDWSYFVKVWQDEPLRRANFGYLGHMFELYAMWTWAPQLLRDAYAGAGYSLDSASLVSFATVAVGGFGCVAAGRFADRRGRCLTTIVSLLISGTCALAAGSLTQWPVLLTIVCLIWGVSVIADSAQFSAAVSELCDQQYVGTALAIQTCTGFLLTTLTIAALPVLQTWLGWPLATAILAIGPVVGIWNMIRLRGLPQAARLAAGKR